MSRTGNFFRLLVLASALGSSTTVLAVDPLTFTATINGTCAATGATATGTGTFTLNTTSLLFSWNITHTALSSAEQFAHIHGPIAQACGSFGGGLIIAGLNTGSPKVGSMTLTAGQVAELRSGLYYVNIHTTNFPDGEISGVIIETTRTPTVSEWGLSAMALLIVTAGTLLIRVRSAIPSTPLI